MKKALLLLVLSYPLFVFCQKTKLVWSDEFNYKGHPDPGKWGYEEGYVRHNELQYYTVNRLENARVENGNLLIELRKEMPHSFYPTSTNDQWHRYTSASLLKKKQGIYPVISFMPLRDINLTNSPR